jgi:predicted Zn-dependent peptidase
MASNSLAGLLAGRKILDLGMELYQLGLDYLQNFAAMIDRITQQDIQAAAQHYLNPDAYALAVAGPELPLTS